MSCTLIGDNILRDPQPEAIYDRKNDCYRYYFKYKSFLPMDQILEAPTAPPTPAPGTGTAEPEKKFIFCEIWMPVHSPALSFPDNSLVFLRGRIILPPQGAVLETNGFYAIFVEVISAHLRKPLDSPNWTHALLRECTRPEPTIIGKIKEMSDGHDGWTTLIMETTNQVGGAVEKSTVAAIIPPGCYKPEGALKRGAWVIVMGYLTVYTHPGINLIVEVKFVRPLLI